MYFFGCSFFLAVSFFLLELDDIEDELQLVDTVEVVAFELLDSAVLWV